MRKFAHINAATIQEAVSALRRYAGKAKLISGGTDLLGQMKDDFLPFYPEAIINLKTIPGMEFIEENNKALRIGSLTKLEDIATHPIIQKKYAALAESSRKTASPQIREMGTIGGNICQDIRCWFYRNPNNRFPCLRKGGGRCYALEGDNRYHSIFGGSVDDGCYAVHPSDTAPALIALDSVIKTTKRSIKIEDFFEVRVFKTTVLDDDEIVTEIQIPQPPVGMKSAFVKFATRKTIDFPIVNCAAMVQNKGGIINKARICLNAVFGIPYRATNAEETILGQKLTSDKAEEAAEVTIADAKPLEHNAYMVQICRTMIKRAIIACI
jgi:xanthine dehydrogenase YagS FAD-binding subunit